MLIAYSQLINLPVETKSNEFLGKVADLEIDIENYNIRKIHVKSSNLIRGLFEGFLIIDQSQIHEITKEKIIVEDGAKKIKDKKTLSIQLPDAEKISVMTTAERK
ncbi:MAG: PRC-barrel domain-containing protein [bacterium]